MDKENIEKIRAKIISIFDKYVGEDYIVFIFGSFARNTMDRASDIDMAIYSKSTLPDYLIAEIREELENKVPTLRCLDVVNLTRRNINSNLLENILREGLIWKKGRNSEELLRSLKRHLKNSKK
jgi:predicted nucleotidyltransferase